MNQRHSMLCEENSQKETFNISEKHLQCTLYQAFIVNCMHIENDTLIYYTANILDAETATMNCVTRLLALQMHYV